MPNNDTSIFDAAAAQVMHQDAQSTAIQIRNNVQSSVGTSADQAAEYQHLAKYTGVAPATVQAQPEAIRQQAALQSMDADRLVSDQPVLAKYLSSADNTAKSHDDIAPLASVEQAAKALPGPAPTAQAPSFGDTLAGLPMDFLKGLSGSFNKAATGVNIALGGFPVMYDKAASLITGKQTTAAGDAYFQRMVDPLVHDAPAFQQAPNAPFISKAVHGLGNLAGIMSQITLTGGGGEVAAGAGAADSTAAVVGNQLAHGAKSMAFPAVTDAIDTGRNVYQQTGDAQQAIRAAQAQYAASTLGGVVPLSAPGGLAARAIGGFASGAAAGEASRGVMNMALPDNMQQPFDIENTLLGGLTGSLLGGVMGPRPEPSYHEAIRQFYTDSSKAEAAEQGMAALQRLGEAAAASKTRGRDQDAFKEFVRSATEDGNLQDVYVDAGRLAEVLNQSGVTLPELQRTMPEVAAQLAEAAQTKGDIRIPVEDYATHIAGGKLDQALLPHLKVDPDGFTYDQSQQFYQSQHADLKVQAEKILSMKEADDGARAEAQQIHDSVLDQLNATGRFRPEVNNAYAALTRDFYVTTADRLGISPKELADRYPLQVRAESLGGAKTLEQSGSLDVVRQAWDAAGIDHFISERKGTITLSKIVVPDDARGSGKGSEAMQQLIDYADQTGQRIALTPSGDFGGTKKRLVEFYKRFGFVENKGKNKDYEISEAMYRPANSLNQSARDALTIQVDGVRRPITNSRGQLVAEDMHKQLAFWRWFGDSKVVDQAGRPMVRYHATTADFDTFAPASHFGTAVQANAILAYTQRQAEGEQRVMPVYLRIENPKRVEDVTDWAAEVEQAKAEGHDGLVYANWGEFDGDAAGNPHDSYVVFSPEQIKSATGNDGSFDAADPNILSQGEETRRGMMSFGDDITAQPTVITLLKNADLSTFLHESGHFYLEVLHDIARAPDAPQGVRDDFDTLLKSFGVAGDSAEARLADWTARTLDQKRDGHEQFARGFEAYLMEGKAPTLELQSLYSRFRSWLVTIYQSLKNLNVDLTDDVRGVMDRLLATDDAIKYTEQARSYLPVHVEGTAEEVAAYQAMGRNATDKAIAEMDARSLRDMKWASNAKNRAIREMQKLAASERNTIRDEVEREFNAQPVEQARTYLKSGKMFDADGNELPDTRPLGAPDTKLSKADLAEMYPKDALGNPDLAKLRGLTSDAGMHPDIVAEMFGIRDGHELVRQLVEARPAKEVIGPEVDRRMLERHGDLVDPVSVERVAEAAVHNEARARFIATGLKMLAKSPIPARQLAEAAREAAEAAVAAKRVRDLRPAQYSAAEGRANKEAIKLAAKDPKGAVEQQRAALLNNRLFKAATDAVAEVQKGVAYLAKFDRAAVREKIALEYRDQIDAILERFDLRKSVTNSALDARQSLLSFVEQLAGQGLEPQIPEGLLNEARRTSFKDMTVEEFRGLVDAVKSLDHLGRGVQKVADGEKAANIADLAAEAAGVMATLPQRSAESNRGLTRIDAALLKLKSAGRSAQASLLKMEQMMDWLDDRNSQGVFNRIVFRRIADAGVKEADLLAGVKKEIDKLLEANLADVTRERGKVYEARGLIDGLTGQPQRFTKKEMLALAGNMGNESNMKKLLAGERWSETAVWQFLNENMSKADWDFVAGMGRTLESLWPEKVAMSRRLGNTNPDKIAPRAFDTPHGRYEGWYWPMIYDPARSHDVAMRGARDADSLFENTYARANTDTGRSNTRNENYARPLLLSIDAIPRVIRDEVHDIAYREAIMDADKFLRDATVRKSIVGALSQEHYDQLRPWLQSIANDRKVDMQALKWFDALAHGARTRATIVGLGYRLSTMLVHGSSAALESVAEVGPVWFGKGLADFANPANWKANQDFVFERSGEMRNRMNEVDRDVREHLREIDIRLSDPASGALARGTDLMKAHAYQGIAMLDMASALPTWMAAYHKGMAPEAQGGKGLSEQDAIYFADKTVRNAHGGTGVKDLAAVQRGPEFFKLFTMFYTFWNHNVNRLMDTARLAGDKRTWQDSTQAATVIMRFLIYTLGVQAMHGLLHPKQDDEGETNWLKWAATEFTAAAFAGIPILRDLSAHYLTGKDYSVTPAAGMVDTIGQSGTDVANALTGKETNPKVLKHSLATAGYVFGLPLGQVSGTAQFLWDVTQGKQDPQTMQDWWNGILHGKIDH